MSSWKNKIFATLIVSFFTTTLFAVEQDKRSLENQMNQVKQKNIYGSFGGKDASSRSCPENLGAFFTIDFLYWRAGNEGFAYALNVFEGDPFGNFVGTETVRISYDWDPGVRVGFGWNTNYDDWDVYGTWTYYHNHSRDRKSVIPSAVFGTRIGLFTLWAVEDTGAVGFAKSSWILNYNTADLELARAYFIGKALSIRPHFGIRAGWLYQDFRVRYDNAPSNVLRIPAVITAENNFWGVGPRMGLNSDWHLGSIFSVFGDVAASLLYGKMRAHFLSRQFDNSTGVFFPPGTFDEDFNELIPTVQMLLGLSMSGCVNHDKMFLSLRVGWETNYWWNQMHLPLYVQFIEYPGFFTKPIVLEGIIVDAKLDF